MPADARSPYRVLVVDDHADVRRLVESVLETHGAFVVVGEAADGQAAIDAAAELQPDAVLLDVQMPVMTGIDALPGIRDAAPSAVVVVLTAIEHVRDQALDAGAAAVMAKGGPVDEIARVLLDALSAGHHA